MRKPFLRLLATVGLTISVICAAADIPVVTSIRVEPGVLTAGAEAQLKVHFVIGARWHVYGKTGGEFGQRALDLKLELPPGMEAIGDWIWPKAETAFIGKDVDLYRGEQVFVHRIRATTAQGGAAVKVTVAYQACTEEMCDLPRHVVLTADIEVRRAAQ